MTTTIMLADIMFISVISNCVLENNKTGMALVFSPVTFLSFSIDNSVSYNVRHQISIEIEMLNFSGWFEASEG